MSDLTPRQRQILALIQQCIADNGLPPTRAEIAGALGFRSANAAEEHLRALARKGVIELKAGASRGIVLKDVLREQLGLPLVGRVAAGRPIRCRPMTPCRDPCGCGWRRPLCPGRRCRAAGSGPGPGPRAQATTTFSTGSTGPNR